MNSQNSETRYENLHRNYRLVQQGQRNLSLMCYAFYIIQIQSNGSVYRHTGIPNNTTNVFTLNLTRRIREINEPTEKV
jgi:hypothetical protein